MAGALKNLTSARATPDGTLWDGVAFASRHGDDLRMWAIFERPGDRPISRKLTILTESEINRSDSILLHVFHLHGPHWEPR